MRWKTGRLGAWVGMVLAAALAAVLALAMPTVPLGAQERMWDEVDLPRNVAEEIVDFFNRSGTIRFHGRAEIPAGKTIQGDVAVLGGPVEIAGEIQGDVVVVNGDLTVLAGGRITGDLTVVGGWVVAEPGAVGGQTTVYEEALPYRRSGERITYSDRSRRWDRDFTRGRSYFTIRNEGNYNRVEGLPLMFGPVFRSNGSDEYFRADVMGIWKSEGGFHIDPDEWGYFVRAEQHLGPGGHFSIGATAHSLITPIEDGGLRDIEASLATFLFHRDYRDYYEREGFSGFVRYDDPDAGLRFTAEYRDEDHSFAPSGSPWTIRGNDDPWRGQPLVGEGRVRTLGGEIRVDDRNDPEDPSDGWYLELTAWKGLSGSLTRPAYWLEYPDPVSSIPQAAAEAALVDTDFAAGSLDLRRYTRLGPTADLRLRGFLGGSMDGKPLPPQFQRTLGGEGSLPGYPLMSLDCGARSTQVYAFDHPGAKVDWYTPAYPAYGCDRVALFQAEYRGSLSFNLDLGGDDDWDEGWGWYPGTRITPSWSVFFDAGRGWTLSEPGSPAYLGPDTDTLMDVGVGFFLGDLGLYWTWPLTGDNRDVNFFVRIDHRF